MSIIPLQLDYSSSQASALSYLASILSVDVILCAYCTSQIQQLAMWGAVQCLVRNKEELIDAGDGRGEGEDREDDEEKDYEEGEEGEGGDDDIDEDDDEGKGGDEPPAKRRKKDEDDDKKKKDEKGEEEDEEDVCVRS